MAIARFTGSIHFIHLITSARALAITAAARYRGLSQFTFPLSQLPKPYLFRNLA
jgi:hypothetical protein